MPVVQVYMVLIEKKLDESKPSEHPISVLRQLKNPMKCLHMFTVIYSIYLLQD